MTVLHESDVPEVVYRPADYGSDYTGFSPEDGDYEPKITWEEFTPERCKVEDEDVASWAESHGVVVNRKTNIARAEDVYAQDMRDGNWTGEVSDPIVYTHSASLQKYIRRNGYHRSTACQAAGVPFWSFVLWNPRDGALSHIDQGLNRSKANLLEFAGVEVKYATVLAQTIGYLNQWRRNEVAERPGDSRFISTVRPYSHDQMLDVFGQRQEELTTAVRTGVDLAGTSAMGGSTTLGPAVIAYMLLALRVDEKPQAGLTAANFLAEVTQGIVPAGVTSDGTARVAAVLLKRIEKQRKAVKGKNNGFSAPDQMKLVLGAWDAYRNERPNVKFITAYSPPGARKKRT